MPEYNFNYQLGPTTKPMTLGDMLNLAAGAQGLQQSMQMNPLQLEQQRQATRQQQLLTGKAEALTPQEIQTGRVRLQEEEKQAPIATQKAQFERDKAVGVLATQIIGGVGTDPRIQNAAQDPKGAIDALTQTAQVMVASGIDPKVAQMFLAPVIAVAQNEPGKLPQVMKNISGMGTTSEAQTGRMTPQVGTIGGAPALVTPALGKAQPLNIEQPGMPQQPAPSGQVPQGQQLPTVGGVSLAYPVRQAGDIRPMAPSEAEDTKVQQQNRNDLISRQRTLTSAERISDEVIKTAEQIEKEAYFSKGGKLAAIERKFNMWIESEKYDRLAKDLANQALANAKVLGTSDTVGGLNMAEAATGSVKIPPEVLIEIARRNKADQTNIDLQAKAKNAFAKQFGDNNGATFDQIWRNNSDSRLFEAMSIDKSKMSYEQKQKAYKKLFEGMSPEDMADFKRKKANIDAMVNGNFAGVK
jgi:hypothetical protein